jgi:hypothetical protein
MIEDEPSSPARRARRLLAHSGSGWPNRPPSVRRPAQQRIESNVVGCPGSRRLNVHAAALTARELEGKLRRQRNVIAARCCSRSESDLWLDRRDRSAVVDINGYP